MSDRIAEAAKLAPSASLTVEEVRSVRHWNEHLFSFTITRPPSFRFRSGEFVMIGLPGEGRPLLRAYSIASPAYADELEFLSIKVPDGPLTSRLQKIQPGDPVYLGRKPTGTLVADALLPGQRLFLLSTGTGLAPWLSVAREPSPSGSKRTVTRVGSSGASSTQKSNTNRSGRSISTNRPKCRARSAPRCSKMANDPPGRGS